MYIVGWEGGGGVIYEWNVAMIAGIVVNKVVALHRTMVRRVSCMMPEALAFHFLPA